MRIARKRKQRSVVQLKITWKGNEQGPLDRLVVERPTQVAVTLIDDNGSACEVPHVVSASMQEGADERPLAPLRVHNSIVQYRIERLAWWTWRSTKLKIRAAAADGFGPAIERNIALASVSTRWLTYLAKGVLLMASLYAFFAFPQSRNFVDFLRFDATMPIVGAGAVLLSWMRPRILAWLEQPLVAALATPVALFGVVYLRSQVEVVVNRSLDPITARAEIIKPGEYAIVLRAQQSDPLCELPKDDCVGFDAPEGLGLALSSALFLKQRRYGCRRLDLPENQREAWRQAGSCRIPAGMTLENVRPGDALKRYSESEAVADKVSLRLPWNDGLHRPDANQFRALQFELVQEDRTARTADSRGSGMTMTMTGTGLLSKVDVVVGSGRPVLSPVLAKDGGWLEGQVIVGSRPIGSLRARIDPANVTPPSERTCWLIPTGERLAALLLRAGGEAAGCFRATEPEFVSLVPMCWTSSVRPTSGEIRLDGAWSPAENWTLDLPDRLVPSSLKILDQQGAFWGHLTCGTPDEAAPQNAGEPTAAAGGSEASRKVSVWHVGPLHIRNPRPELRVLAAAGARWQTAPGRPIEAWAWGCWVGPEAPRVWKGEAHWNLIQERRGQTHEARDPAISNVASSRAYYAQRGLEKCCVYQDGRPARCDCERAGAKDAAKWLADYGVKSCDPKEFTLCK